MIEIARMVLVGTMLVALAGSAAAQTPTPAPHIEYAELTWSGFFGAGTPVPPGPIRRYVTHTPIRKVIVGTKYDMKVRIVGKPDGAGVTLRFVVRAPRPGMKDPKTGALRREDAVEVAAKIGGEVDLIFEFKDQAQIVSGTWRAEVWNGRRRLAMRRFAVQ